MLAWYRTVCWRSRAWDARLVFRTSKSWPRPPYLANPGGANHKGSHCHHQLNEGPLPSTRPAVRVYSVSSHAILRVRCPTFHRQSLPPSLQREQELGSKTFFFHPFSVSFSVEQPPEGGVTKPVLPNRDEFCVCNGFYSDEIGKRHLPRGINSDRMDLGSLSHGLLTYTSHLQTMVFVLPPSSTPQGSYLKQFERKLFRVVKLNFFHTNVNPWKKNYEGINK